MSLHTHLIRKTLRKARPQRRGRSMRIGTLVRASRARRVRKRGRR